MVKRIFVAVAAVMVLAVSCAKNDAKGNFGVDGVTPLPEAVDLGIIVNGKNVKWASFNLGAARDCEYGDYYAWGEIQSKADYSWETYAFSTGAYNKLTKYCPKDQKSYWDYAQKPDGPEGKTSLYPVDDVVQVKLGGNWRMPTDVEWTALRSNCVWTWTNNYNGTGVAGRIGRSKVEGYKDRSIFLPAGGRWDGASLTDKGSMGYYWSSDLDTYEPNCAGRGAFNNGAIYGGSSYRYCGQSVRPVSE